MTTARTPGSTYRLQLRPEFGFDEAAAVLPYLRDLGVTHVYLSPVLQAQPGSEHGYDVIDHTQLSSGLGGAEGFRRFSDAAHSHGLGVVVDVVPNHMAVPTPVSLNAALWSVLRDGPASSYAHWFDVDWAAQERAILMPVLGRRIGQCVADGEITLDRSGAEPVVRYFDKVFPVRAGTADLPLETLLDRQFYRLAHWRVGDEELNYRRFFDIDTLVAIRVEDVRVFAETHAVLLALVAEGRVDGLRIDHPDGLAAPRDYLRRLHAGTEGAWVVVEKILEGDESLPDDWPCAGTTGYDALLRAGGLFVDPAGAEPLGALYAALTGEPTDFAPVVEEAKRWVVEHGLVAEVHRLVELAAAICHAHLELRDHTRRGLRESLVELLVAFPVYRAYVVPGEPAPTPPGASSSTPSRRLASGCPRSGTTRWTWSPRSRSARAAGAAPRRVRRALPADLRPRDGQGRGGHRVLPLAAAHRAQRGRRRPHAPGRHARRAARLVRRAPSATGPTR